MGKKNIQVKYLIVIFTRNGTMKLLLAAAFTNTSNKYTINIVI